MSTGCRDAGMTLRGAGGAAVRGGPIWGVLGIVVLLGASVVPAGGGAQPAVQQPLDVVYVPTPHAVVQAMLEAVKVGPRDVVFDLGSGDGRIPISAVRDFGAARAVGIELDPQRIAEARANAAAAGVGDRVSFVLQDLFDADLSAATVIAMYLLPAINARLEPRLRALASGTRIVSHNYDMGPAWQPSRSFVVMNNVVHIWTVRHR